MLSKRNEASLPQGDLSFTPSKGAANESTRGPGPDLAFPFDLRNDLRPGDLGAIVSLHGAVYARECGFDLAFEAHVAQLLGEFVNARTDRDRLRIAEWERRLVGSIAIVGHSRRDAELCWFLVDPLVRALGLGRRLLQEAVTFCRRWEYEYVFFRNFRVRTTTSHLLRSVGFTKVGEKPGQRWGVAVIEELYTLYPLGQRLKVQDDEPICLA